MKKIICLLILVIPIIAFTQSEISWYSIPDESDHVIKKGYNNSNEFTNRYYKEQGTFHRTLSFDISFNGGTLYELTGNDAQYQTHWQKIMTLACTEDGQRRNSIRLGWRHPTGTDYIELGFYGHLNHYSADDGREFTKITTVKQYEVAHVEMVLSKYNVYLRVNDIGYHVYRDITSWNPDKGEETVVHVNAFFGDGLGFDDKFYKAPENMHFSITNIIVDLNIYWENKWQNEAPYLNFINSRFHYGVDETYIATKRIKTSVYTESAEDAAHNLPYKWIQRENTFTVFEPGSTTEMISPEIILQPGTIVQSGAIAYFGQNYMKSESMKDNLLESIIKQYSYNEFGQLDSVVIEYGDTIINTNKNIDVTFDFNISPNPVQDIVSINTGIDDSYNIRIVTQTGIEIFSSDYIGAPLINFNISSFAPGTYYCIIKCSNGRKLSKPFIKL